MKGYIGRQNYASSVCYWWNCHFLSLTMKKWQPRLNYSRKDKIDNAIADNPSPPISPRLVGATKATKTVKIIAKTAKTEAQTISLTIIHQFGITFPLFL
jgi:hypothetical protein